MPLVSSSFASILKFDTFGDVLEMCNDFPENEEMHFAFASDEKFVAQLLVAVMSLLKTSIGLHNKQIIHILDCGISDQVWHRAIGRIMAFAHMLSVCCDVRRHTIDMSMFSKFRVWHTSRAAYARLLLPYLLADIRYCIYSDCDMLFFDNPWEIVLQLKQEEVAVLGHKNPPDRFGINIDEQWFIAHDKPYNRRTYFCSGLIAMDLDKFRAPGAIQSMFYFLERHPDVVSADQTALNWYFRDDSALASDGWGVFPMECYGDACKIKAVHYVGGLPWKPCDSWYMYLMFNRVDDVWISFAKKVLDSDFQPRVVSFRVKLISSLALGVTRLLIALHLPIAWKKDYLSEARDVIYRHDAIDNARKKLLSGLT